jgi:hypothetical protein
MIDTQTLRAVAGYPGTSKETLIMFLLKAADEIDRLRAEREAHAETAAALERVKADIATVMDQLADAVDERDLASLERDKLIEGLRWYAEAKNYRREFRSRHGTLVEPAEAIYYDCGQRARDILKEIDREHPVKIYDQCVGCEIESLRSEVDRLKHGGWISVNERLPENGRRVMVIDKHENQTVAWCEHGRFWPDNLQFSPSMITHWQPLPEPPKEDESDE